MELLKECHLPMIKVIFSFQIKVGLIIHKLDAKVNFPILFLLFVLLHFLCPRDSRSR